MKKLIAAIFLMFMTATLSHAHIYNECEVDGSLLNDNFEVGQLPLGWIGGQGESFAYDEITLPVTNGGTVKIQNTLPKKYKELWVSFPWRISSDFSLADNVSSYGPGIYQTNQNTLIAAIGLRNVNGVLKFNYRYKIDVGYAFGKTLSSPLPVTGQTYDVKIHWKASPTNKDLGVVEIFVDNHMIMAHREVDNDLAWADTILLGQGFGAAATDITGSYSFGEVEVGKTCN